MRLIDAEALLKNLPTEEFVAKWCVQNAPTAYDVDKVVEELDECSANHFGKHNHYDEGMMDAYDYAIDIVRRGGVDG